MTDLATTGGARGRSSARGDWRLILLMLCFGLCYAAVGVRMALLAAIDPVEPTIAGHDGTARPVRGEIVDRHGNLLAANLPAWSLYAHPREIKDPGAVAGALSAVIPELEHDAILKKLTGKQRFVWLKRPITPREKQAVHDLGFPGLFFGNREMRIYPAGRTAAHIVGGVKAEREDVRFAELAGSGGVEKFFDARLRDPGQAADPLRLSLDIRLQQAMRATLADGVKRFNAKGAAGILMKVRTGEILAMASLPDFDPNQPPRRHRGTSDTNPRFNRAAQGRYELGSTFKVLTAAMALETGVARADTLIETPPRLRFGRHSIGDSHRMDPEMTVEDIVVKSSNVGSARLAMMVRTDRFRGYLDALGMLAPSGLELTEAARAKPLLPPKWKEISTITISFGHGLAASPIHLAAAYATLANDGRRVRPTLLAGGAEPGEQVFSVRTSREMLRILREVVVRGTARRANVEGYEIGGKTGTADKVRREGGYHKDKVISTFASVFPTSNPEYVLIVSLDEPEDRTGRRPVRTAGRTAVPVAAELIRRIVPIMGMRPVPVPVSGVTPALHATLE